MSWKKYKNKIFSEDKNYIIRHTDLYRKEKASKKEQMKVKKYFSYYSSER